MIRATKHSMDFVNTGKKENFDHFRISCGKAVELFLDYIWNKQTIHKFGIFDPQNNHWCCPSMLSTVGINIPEHIQHLSARALKCCMTQALAMIRSTTAKYYKRQIVVKKKQKLQNKKIRYIQSFIDKRKPTKPKVNINKFKIELNSICCKFTEETNTSFDGYITLSGIGKIYGKIYIPIKYTDRSNYWKSKGKIMNSFLCGPKNIEIRWEIEVAENMSVEVVGADGGQNTCLTLSDGLTTQKCIHGHDLKSINKKMSRCKDGSKGSQRKRDHQINYINWTIKNLDLGKYKEIRLESNKHIKRGKKTSKSLRKWSWSKIHKAVILNCEEKDVLVFLQNSPYKSQRCYGCGYTHKLNRKGIEFRCRHCGFICDADMNSALNNSLDLAFVIRSFMALGLNRTGFVWDQLGMFGFDGEEFTVPLGKNVDLIQNISYQ